jgi:diacylglycerol kinase (CTP)
MESASTMLQTRSELHLHRKLWHVGSGLGLYWAIFHSGLSRPGAVLLVTLLLAGDLAIEIARLRWPSLNRLVLAAFGALMRPREVKGLSGTPFYLAGTLSAMLVFPEPVTRLALLFLALGDPAASVAGVLSRQRGPRLARGKTLIGTAASMIVCAAVTLFYVAHAVPDATFMSRLILGFAGSGAALASECLPVALDDNLVYPVVSGLVLWPFAGMLA